MTLNNDIATITDIYIKRSKGNKFWCLMAIIDGEEFLSSESLHYKSIKQTFVDLKARLPYRFSKSVFPSYMEDYSATGYMYKTYYLNTVPEDWEEDSPF